MGDASDLNDVQRFMRSNIGRKKLEGLKAAMLEQTVVDVDFDAEINGVVATIVLSNGETVRSYLPEFVLSALRDSFEDLLEDEYYKDYPDRKPEEDQHHGE